MAFRRAVQRYGRTPEPETPYQRAGQLWDERIGSSRVQARNWRLMAFGCLALATGLSGALAWQSAQSRVTPYVVEVDRLGDGRQTFVEFPTSIAVGEAPPLLVIGATGEAELVNYRMRGRFYVVDRIFDRAELRLGTGKQQVVRIDRVTEGPAPKGKRS